MPSRLRRAFGAVAIAVLALPQWAGAAPTAGDGSTRLAGTTTFLARHSGRAVVTLPAPVTITVGSHGFGPVRGLRFDGGGRVVGLALVSLDGRRGFVDLRFRSCFRPGCVAGGGDRDERVAVAWGGSNPFGSKVSLAPGRYQVSVYADGAPLRATLRLPGLAGRTAIATRLRQQGVVKSPTAHGVGGTPANPVSDQAGAPGRVDTDVNLLAFAHVVDGGPNVTDSQTWCIYPGSGPPGGAMTPGCPDADSMTFSSFSVSGSFGATAYGFVLTLGSGSAGEYWQGVDQTGVAVTTSVKDNFFWADLGVPDQRR